ncbi:ComF family protein [Ruania alkalisoli]|uniref:ComF family protein n=1 Tax=Ruania alkalisoli TaxID=2779775 RepID=A0A7M1SQ95_9MICO|nr:phosphoribosyltransferase family protein [Ruania alkalisoli]QOR69726.1 ComF family protein [Ruania alkalisoli]
MTATATVAWLLAPVRDLLALVLPRNCPGCDAPDVTLCQRCTCLLSGPPRRCEEGTVFLGVDDLLPALGLPVWTLADYTGPVRRVVLAWKSGGRADLDRPLTALMAGAAAGLAADLLADPVPEHGDPALVVVPAPSGWRRRWRRRLVALTLARAVAASLAQESARPVWVADLLRRRGGSGHALGARARRRTTAAAVRCLGPLPPGTACLLVDDVVTTGATLDAARVSLQRAGANVVGAVVLAATAAPGENASALRLSDRPGVD